MLGVRDGTLPQQFRLYQSASTDKRQGVLRWINDLKIPNIKILTRLTT